MADYDWFDRSPYEEENKEVRKTAEYWRALGLTAIFSEHNTGFIGSRRESIKYYHCRRGCGTVVWNPEEHIQNVCIGFKPIIGAK